MDQRNYRIESCAWAIATHRVGQHRFQDVRAQAISLVYTFRPNCEGFDSLEFTQTTPYLQDSCEKHGREICWKKEPSASSEVQWPARGGGFHAQASV